MADTPPRADLERIWAEVRSAFAEYRLDYLKKHLDIPQGMPVPNRGQAKQFAEALPDLARARFLKIASEGDLCGYYAQINAGRVGTEVTVVRFRRMGAQWKLVPTPHTLSTFATDENLDPAQLIETEAALRLNPDASPAHPSPSAPPGETADARPAPEIRKELEALWKRIRSAFAAGHPEAAAADLLYTDGVSPPSPDEAKAAVLPDLIRSQFLKLGWREDKPHLAGYYAETKVGDFKKSTVTLIVFVRHEGRWKFAPGPAAIETVEVKKSSRAGLHQLIDTDPRLKL
jgi:hypothetical protein